MITYPRKSTTAECSNFYENIANNNTEDISDNRINSVSLSLVDFLKQYGSLDNLLGSGYSKNRLKAISVGKEVGEFYETLCSIFAQPDNLNSSEMVQVAATPTPGQDNLATGFG